MFLQICRSWADTRVTTDERIDGLTYGRLAEGFATYVRESYFQLYPLQGTAWTNGEPAARAKIEKYLEAYFKANSAKLAREYRALSGEDAKLRDTD